MSELELMFSDKDFPESISKKMIEKGFIPVAGYWKAKEFVLLIQDDVRNFYKPFSFIFNRFYYSIKLNDIIPAWSADQLWGFLAHYEEIFIKSQKYLLVLEAYPHNNETFITIYYDSGTTKIEKDGCEIKVWLDDKHFDGKLTDPQVSAKLLILLEEKGLLERRM